MSKGRMEAFSDGVLAIIITIMVLKLDVPQSMDLAALTSRFPILVTYVMSFTYVGIYWANHHHLIAATHAVNGKMLWANLHWLFWMSLIPFGTEWIGAHPQAPIPVCTYGVILWFCSLSYFLLQATVIWLNGKDSAIAQSIGRDRKGKLSTLAYTIAPLCAFWVPWVSYLIYIGTALAWVIPDLRLENISS